MVVDNLFWNACKVTCVLNPEHDAEVGRCSAHVYGLNAKVERVEAGSDSAWLNVVEHPPNPTTESERLALWAAETLGRLRHPRSLSYARVRVLALDARKLALAAELWEVDRTAPGQGRDMLRWPVRIELFF